MRMALFPVENASGVSVATREVGVRLELELRRRGLDVASGDIVEDFLSRHRIRYTAGVDAETSRAAREELGVEAVLVASVDLYRARGTPQFGLSVRLVSAEEAPRILWMDGTERAGDDSLGLFGLGAVGSVQELEDAALSRLVESLSRFLQGTGPAVTRCTADGRFEPRVFYRSPLSRHGQRVSVAVLPFVNQTSQPNAGEVIALAFVRDLAAADWIDVRDPGVVRTALLRHRIVLEGGVSHEAARVSLGSMEVDVVISGRVHAFDGSPRVEFTAVALDTWTNHVVWQSSSFNQGSDGVFFFDAGRVSTASELACRMVREVGDEMVRFWAQGRSAPPRRSRYGRPGEGR
jgi:TolB-like protein